MKVWDKYLNNLDQKHKDLVVNTLNIAKSYLPEAKETMLYGVPGLEIYGKPLIAVAAHKKHLGIYPFSPKVVKKIKSERPTIETSEGTIPFIYDEVPTKEIIQSIVLLRFKEIQLFKG